MGFRYKKKSESMWLGFFLGALAAAGTGFAWAMGMVIFGVEHYIVAIIAGGIVGGATVSTISKRNIMLGLVAGMMAIGSILGGKVLANYLSRETVTAEYVLNDTDAFYRLICKSLVRSGKVSPTEEQRYAVYAFELGQANDSLPIADARTKAIHKQVKKIYKRMKDRERVEFANKQIALYQQESNLNEALRTFDRYDFLCIALAGIIAFFTCAARDAGPAT